MTKLYFKIEIDSFYDTESNHWIVKAKDYNISGYGKNLKEAKGMVLSCLNESLNPNENYTQKLNFYKNTFRELKGQLLSYGIKEDSILIKSIETNC